MVHAARRRSAPCPHHVLSWLQRGDLSGGRLGPFWDKLVFSKVKARVGGERGAEWQA